MTREEARVYGEEWIKDIDSLCDSDKRNLDDEDEEMYEFLKVAVSALKEKEKSSYDKSYNDGFK